VTDHEINKNKRTIQGEIQENETRDPRRFRVITGHFSGARSDKQSSICRQRTAFQGQTNRCCSRIVENDDTADRGVSMLFRFSSQLDATTHEAFVTLCVFTQGSCPFDWSAIILASSSAIRPCRSSMIGTICFCENRLCMCCGQFTSQASISNRMARSTFPG
jgi:hypothetical protein